MRFLVDAQLPPALARWLKDRGHDAEHVFDVGMASADDRDVWNYARSIGAVIVSKDEDFANRRAVDASGPSVIWIRRGNTTRRELLTWFEPLLPDVLDALARGDLLIEIV
jgi:predicted nuclease of predicted toxin-antitoxin system